MNSMSVSVLVRVSVPVRLLNEPRGRRGEEDSITPPQPTLRTNFIDQVVGAQTADPLVGLRDRQGEVKEQREQRFSPPSSCGRARSSSHKVVSSPSAIHLNQLQSPQDQDQEEEERDPDRHSSGCPNLNRCHETKRGGRPWDLAVSMEKIPEGLVRAETTDCFLSRDLAARGGIEA
jgi:hypothetical protein